MNPRRVLLDLFDAALRAVDGAGCVARRLQLPHQVPVSLIAVGKAASAMALGAHSVLGDLIRQVLLITKQGHGDPGLALLPDLRLIESAHPVPDERSLAAGAELERHLAQLPAAMYPVFLVSGGSSSLVEALRPGHCLEELRALNERGLAAGWDIAHLNAERAVLSRLKGGGVTSLLHGRHAHALFISDVPGDDPAVIGSGLLGRTPGHEDRVTRVVVASVADAVRAATTAARAHGLELEARDDRFEGCATDVAARFLECLRDTSADGLVWGGESTVMLPRAPGRGGRNQHLALAAARALRAGEPVSLLAAGTDGTDGPTEDAGAIVDAGTVERAELAGVDVEKAFAACDSGTALEAAGDLLHTGPTGTNVGDLLIGLKPSARRVRDPAAPRMV
jgi:glycerate 2-kinase